MAEVSLRRVRWTLARLCASREVTSSRVRRWLKSRQFLVRRRFKSRTTSSLGRASSCEPNIGVQGQIVFVALRQILPGEELTHDWATTDDDDYTLECRCGAPTCRRILTGKDWKRQDLQRKYHGLFSWYIERLIGGII